MMDDEMGDDDDLVLARLDEARRARDRELDDLRAVLALPAGQRVLGRWLMHLGVLRGFSPADQPAAAVRNAALFILGEARAADPEAAERLIVDVLRKGIPHG